MIRVAERGVAGALKRCTHKVEINEYDVFVKSPSADERIWHR